MPQFCALVNILVGRARTHSCLLNTGDKHIIAFSQNVSVNLRFVFIVSFFSLAFIYLFLLSP